jgi:putative PIN family toxin of toxin-antitoxin system
VRVVVDTNVIISRLNFPGKEREVLDLARSGSYDFYLSTFILKEVSGVLHRKFGWSQNLVDNAIRMLANWATVIDPEISISIVKRNDADNRILECAIAAKADYIVTGDRRDLLPLKQFQGIKIVNSVQFISILGI